MNESDIWRVAILATDYDAIPFIHIGRFGIQPVLMPRYRKDLPMHGNGAKYVTLPDDKNVHLYAETEATVCGISIPIASGAEWTYAEPAKVCPACTKDKAKK